jgi:cation transport protein ChaC
VRYRGTVETPGLVMGLDRGGACLGRAYRVTRTDWASVCAYLHDREMVTNTYMPKFLKVRLDDGREVPAYTFIVRRDHRQYTGKLSEERIVELVLQGAGWEGTSAEYLANTVAHMDELGIPEGPLHKILERVQAG